MTLPPRASLEVVNVPVADVDRALAFYRDRLEFVLDVDYAPHPGFRVVQLTPAGSGCSIQLASGPGAAPPGSLAGATLVVDDLEAVHARLEAAGVTAGEIRHKTPPGAWDGGFAEGLDSHRADYASFADVTDPDGNVWTLQERGHGAG
jgi:catechol 2,3-dioxygenase-like lactoylglutathione lyase family enzyme